MIYKNKITINLYKSCSYRSNKFVDIYYNNVILNNNIVFIQEEYMHKINIKKLAKNKFLSPNPTCFANYQKLLSRCQKIEFIKYKWIAHVALFFFL